MFPWWDVGYDLVSCGFLVYVVDLEHVFLMVVVVVVAAAAAGGSQWCSVFSQELVGGGHFMCFCCWLLVVCFCGTWQTVVNFLASSLSFGIILFAYNCRSVSFCNCDCAYPCDRLLVP